jgi:hypothetical protein
VAVFRVAVFSSGCFFERLVAFSCKKRGFCPSCGARRMAETAALLSDEVFPDVPLRQWVISFPFPLRYPFAAHPQAMGKVLGIICRAISTHLLHKAGYRLKDGATGAVTLIQRFGSALNLNERHAAMTWAQRLKRVFNIDIGVCGRCGGSVRIVACIEDQNIIDRILAHLESKEQNPPALPHLASPTRAPPETLPLFAGSESKITILNQQGR